MGKLKGVDISQRNDTVTVDLFYPEYEDDVKDKTKARFVEVGLCSVRAADNVRIHYSFKRDGWVIEQASVFEWEAGDKDADPCWKEVAFVQAWALDTDPYGLRT